MMNEVFEVAEGKLTKAEILNFMETAVVRLCNFV